MLPQEISKAFADLKNNLGTAKLLRGETSAFTNQVATALSRGSNIKLIENDDIEESNQVDQNKVLVVYSAPYETLRQYQENSFHEISRNSYVRSYRLFKHVPSCINDSVEHVVMAGNFLKSLMNDLIEEIDSEKIHFWFFGRHELNDLMIPKTDCLPGTFYLNFDIYNRRNFKNLGSAKLHYIDKNKEIQNTQIEGLAFPLTPIVTQRLQWLSERQNHPETVTPAPSEDAPEGADKNPLATVTGTPETKDPDRDSFDFHDFDFDDFDDFLMKQSEENSLLPEASQNAIGDSKSEIEPLETPNMAGTGIKEIQDTPRPSDNPQNLEISANRKESPAQTAQDLPSDPHILDYIDMMIAKIEETPSPPLNAEVLQQASFDENSNVEGITDASIRELYCPPSPPSEVEGHTYAEQNNISDKKRKSKLGKSPARHSKNPRF